MRSFGRPTGIGPEDRIWLVIERAAACVVALNGRVLAAASAGDGPWRHDVTTALQERNELQLTFNAARADAAAGRGPLPEWLGVVTLIIESGC